MKKLLIIAALLCGFSWSNAYAQGWIKITNCGDGSPPAGVSPGYMNSTGQVCISLGTGSLVIGKVGIDQTTPGTTNGVALEQIGSTTVLTGAGPTGAGSERVTVAQDTTTIAGTPSATGHGTAAGALRVELPTDGTGQVVTGTYGRVDASPAVQNASYVSGNDIGGLVAFTLPATASGILQSLSIQFVGGATTAITVNCFDSNPTGSTFTDKSTYTIAAADTPKMINKAGIVLTPAVSIGGTRTAATFDNYAKPFISTGTIWCAFAGGGTFTPASTTDMNVSIAYYQNAK